MLTAADALGFSAEKVHDDLRQLQPSLGWVLRDSLALQPALFPVGNSRLCLVGCRLVTLPLCMENSP